MHSETWTFEYKDKLIDGHGNIIIKKCYSGIRDSPEFENFEESFND